MDHWSGPVRDFQNFVGPRTGLLIRPEFLKFGLVQVRSRPDFYLNQSGPTFQGVGPGFLKVFDPGPVLNISNFFGPGFDPWIPVLSMSSWTKSLHDRYGSRLDGPR